MTALKNKLYYTRTQKGLSQKDISEMYQREFGEKLSVRNIRLIETFEKNPSSKVMLNLAELLTVSFDYLMDRADTPEEELLMHKKGLRE